jgi:hypothetical protein
VAVTSARNSRQASQATIEAACEGQFAERYSKALEQVSSDNRDVWIGGLYALEGVAFDCIRSHQTVLEVLTAPARSCDAAQPDAAQRAGRRPGQVSGGWRWPMSRTGRSAGDL